MALTISERKDNLVGRKRQNTAKITFPNPYVALGIPFDPADLGIKVPENVVIDPTATYEFSYDRTNKKIQVWVRATGAEAGAIDLSAVSTYVTVVGS